jgi:hypothetical protein
MMTTHPFNALAIGQYTQALNNRLYCYFDGINAIQKVKSFFLVGNNSSFQPKDSISVKTSVKVRTKYAVKTFFLMRTNHCMGLNFKSRFLESIKRKKGKQIPPISGIKLKDYFLFDLASFSRQASLTHELKLPLPATKSICASKSSSKRICLVVLLERSKDFLSFLSCIGSYRYDKLNLKGSYHYICNYLKKAMPRSAGTLSRHLTTNIKRSNAMANSNDTLRPKNGQPDLSNLISVLNLYQADIKSSKKHLHNLNHSGYIDNALAKSKVRIGTLNSYLATHDAQSVFFCVNACAHLFINISSMVALVGHPKGWLGHQVTSSSNPANVTANEIGTSSGDYVNHYLEAVTMTTIPIRVISNQKLFKFYDLSTAQVVQTTATTEQQARKSLGKPSLIFIARIRLYPVIEQVQKFGGYHYE